MTYFLKDQRRHKLHKKLATALAAAMPWVAEVACGGIDPQKMLASPCTDLTEKFDLKVCGGSMSTQTVFASAISTDFQ